MTRILLYRAPLPATASWRMSSRSPTQLCLKARIFAPERRAPSTMELWLSASQMMRSPGPQMAGMTVELVAKPIPTTTAASLPTNRAVVSSTSFTGALCCSALGAPLVMGLSRIDCTTSGVQWVFKPPKPR